MSLFNTNCSCNCNCNCNCKCNCTIAAFIISAIIGVITTILQITGTVTLTPVFLWAAFGVAIAYLGALTIAAAVNGKTEGQSCICNALNTVLAGVLGTIALAAVIAVIGITATSIVSAILSGLLLFFLALTVITTTCLIRYLTDCRN